MVRAVASNFLPVKIHIKEQKPAFGRFNVQWTPTLLVLDHEGVERHRTEGFLPEDDLLAQLDLGLAKLHFQRGAYQEAEKRFRAVHETWRATAAAPEACYWAGVAAYKATNDAKALHAAALQLKNEFPETDWAKKSTVWL